MHTKPFSLPPSSVDLGGTEYDRVSPPRYDAAKLRRRIEENDPDALKNAVVWLLKKIEEQE